MASDSPSDQPNRRPRVREVSSRFMTPLIPSKKPTNSPRSKSVQRRLIPKTDENHPPETTRKHHNSRSLTTDRIVPSRYNKTPIHPSNSLNTAAARLLQQATNTPDDSDASSTTSCPNSPLFVPLNRQRSVTSSRVSMSDVDKWLTGRNNNNNNDNNNNNKGGGGGECARSLNFSGKIGGSLPPRPSANVNKGGRGHQEDVHSLKMMSNHYLQWRFANAKAEACVRARKQEAEKQLYSLGAKISDIRDNVTRKRKELAVLRGINTLNTVVEAQMPYLDGWSTVEDDFSTSLSGTTDALLNSLTRLPVCGNVRVDVGELQEALSSAVKVAESIGSNIQRFMQKAEEMDTSSSELAKMAGGERSLIEECEFILNKNYSSQVMECSLMATQMQLHNTNHGQPQKT